jgi:hypothetical protein
MIHIDLNHILYGRAFEYIQKCQNFPCVQYQINIQQTGKTSEFTFYHGYLTFPFYVTKGRMYYVSLLAFPYICNCRKYSMLIINLRYWDFKPFTLLHLITIFFWGTCYQSLYNHAWDTYYQSFYNHAVLSFARILSIKNVKFQHMVVGPLCVAHVSSPKGSFMKGVLHKLVHDKLQPIKLDCKHWIMNNEIFAQ